MRISHSGDVIVKRLSKANVFVHRVDESFFEPTFNGRYANADCIYSSSDMYAHDQSDPGELYGVAGSSAQSKVATRATTRMTTGRNNLLQNNISSSSAASSSSHYLMSSGFHEPTAGGSSSAGSSSASALKSNSSTAMLPRNRLANANSTLASSSYNSNNNKLQRASVKCQSHSLEFNRQVRVFDMSKFKASIERELRSKRPNRRRLLARCVCVVSFVVEDKKLLNLPSWIVIFNIVAMDLLKTELNVRSMNELVRALSSSSSSHNLLAHSSLCASSSSSSFEQHNSRAYALHASRRDNGQSQSQSDIGRRAPSKSRGCQQQQQSDAHQVAASKRAFASAIASGAYARKQHEEAPHIDHYDVKGMHAAKTARQPAVLQPKLRNETAPSGRVAKATDTSIMHKLARANQVAQHCVEQRGRTANCCGCEHHHDTEVAHYGDDDDEEEDESKQSSPSSGFDSNCSQSSSNQHDRLSDDTAKEDVAPEQQRQQKQHLSAAVARGQRAPKLPMRARAPQPPSGAVCVSEPIPIPAPPTSTGAEPSGRANLILVSPTGLSPPTPKRNNNNNNNIDAEQREAAAVDKASVLMQEHQRNLAVAAAAAAAAAASAANASASANSAAANSAVGEQKKSPPPPRPKLPEGIPAHAQLAPPATQRYILRYLKAVAKQQKQQQQQQQPAWLIAASANQRPLPVVPSCAHDTANQMRQRANTAAPESHRHVRAPPPAPPLVPQFMRQPPPPPPPPMRTAGVRLPSAGDAFQRQQDAFLHEPKLYRRCGSGWDLTGSSSHNRSRAMPKMLSSKPLLRMFNKTATTTTSPSKQHLTNAKQSAMHPNALSHSNKGDKLFASEDNLHSHKDAARYNYYKLSGGSSIFAQMAGMRLKRGSTNK